MIVTCKVIEDLLPLYADGICSEDTKTVVEHHTAECADCRKKLEAMTSDTVETEKSGEEKPSPENPFKKLRRHYTRLVVCTLLICAAVMIPSALVFRLYVNEETNQGMSFSSIAVSRELKKFGNMFKRGEYRKALESVELYYQDGYTPAEIAAFKNMFAADLEEYYKTYPIKKVKVEAADGKSDNGTVQLYLDAEKYKGTGKEPVQYIYFEFRKEDDGSRTMILGGGESWVLSDDDDYDRELNATFPPLQLFSIDTTEYFFDKFKEESNPMFWFWFSTAENIALNDEKNDDGISKTEIVDCVYSQKLRKLLRDYSYVGCESGTMTYVQEDILDMRSYFSQHTVLTMSKAEGSEFTAEFDVPILYTGGFTHLKNVSYSDNTPDDFKRQFEDIFVNDEPVYDQYKEQKLNDGKFYLNGNTESCYYEVGDGRIQLVVENEEQAREFYETVMANTTNEALRNWKYDDWYISFIDGWDEPSEYKIIPTSFGVRIAYDFSYGPDGEMWVRRMFEYADSDHIVHNNCIFTRV
ncbi:MAG: zf-HC2 domain-containing protein [Oscillospiraceae bacterium]|nr:zf-HC2 domain-containing protein [Oscillospiraceae bacterium]